MLPPEIADLHLGAVAPGRVEEWQVHLRAPDRLPGGGVEDDDVERDQRRVASSRVGDLLPDRLHIEPDGEGGRKREQHEGPYREPQSREPHVGGIEGSTDDTRRSSIRSSFPHRPAPGLTAPTISHPLRYESSVKRFG